MGIPFPRRNWNRHFLHKQSPDTGDTTDSAEKSSESSTSEQGKEFYTIQTASEKVFYLVIDRDGDEEKVYFLTEVSENDLLNTTSDNSETLPKNSAALESAIPVKDAALDNNNTDATGNKKQDAETVKENTGRVPRKEVSRKLQNRSRRVPLCLSYPGNCCSCCNWRGLYYKGKEEKGKLH